MHVIKNDGHEKVFLSLAMITIAAVSLITENGNSIPPPLSGTINSKTVHMRYRSLAVNDKLIRFVGKNSATAVGYGEHSVTQFDDDNGREKHVQINWPQHK
jgi:hypothetical protein